MTSLFFCSLILIGSFTFIESHQGDPRCHEDGDKCNADESGYYSCGYWPSMQVLDYTKCSRHQICKCRYEDTVDRYCSCVKNEKLPSLPKYGVVRYSGKKEFLGYGYQEDELTKLNVTVYKYKNGYYLKKWSEENRGIVKNYFEIIVPSSDGTFTKYDTECKKSSSSEGQLQSLWQQKFQKKYYRLDSETPLKNRLIKQVWKMEADHDPDYEVWYWTVKYDSAKNVAYPVSSRYNWETKIETYQIHYDYEYEEVSDGQTIKIEDYCKM